MGIKEIIFLTCLTVLTGAGFYTSVETKYHKTGALIMCLAMLGIGVLGGTLVNG